MIMLVSREHDFPHSQFLLWLHDCRNKEIILELVQYCLYECARNFCF